MMMLEPPGEEEEEELDIQLPEGEAGFSATVPSGNKDFLYNYLYHCFKNIYCTFSRKKVSTKASIQHYYKGIMGD